MNHILKNVSMTEILNILINNTPAAYIILDQDYRIHFMNESFMKMRNLKKETTIGEKCYNISNGGVPCELCAIKTAFETNQNQKITRNDSFKNGKTIYLDDYAIPLYNDENTGDKYILEIMINRSEEFEKREKKNREYTEVLKILLELLDSKDSYTAKHSSNVRHISILIGKALNLSYDELFELSISALLHDIGKVKVSSKILNKPSKLTDEEFDEIKKHSLYSYSMIDGLSSFKKVQKNIRHHHERIDGNGYPDGLKGDDIPLFSKIIAVADTYDAIVSKRCYKDSKSHEIAIEEMKRISGTQLDKQIVDVFCKIDPTKKISKKQIIQRDIKDMDKSDKLIKNNMEFIQKISEEKLIKAIFENTPYGYAILDLDYKLIFASDIFYEYLQLDKEGTLNVPCYKTTHDLDKPCDNCHIKDVLKTKKMSTSRTTRITKKGDEITFDTQYVPIFDKNGNIEYILQIVIDRTKEIKFESKKTEDFEKIITMLNEILENDNELKQDKEKQEKILNLKIKIDKLLAKY